MTLAKNLTLAFTAVMGLLFLAGTGCGPKNEGEKVARMFMERDLARSEAQRSCLLAIPTTGISSEEMANRRAACMATN